jgi:hypothetical protein
MEKKHRNFSDEEIEMLYDQGFLDLETDESINQNLTVTATLRLSRWQRRCCRGVEPCTLAAPPAVVVWMLRI